MPGAMHRMGVYLGLVEDDDLADGEGWDSSRDPSREHVERAPARRAGYAEPGYSRETLPQTTQILDGNGSGVQTGTAQRVSDQVLTASVRSQTSVVARWHLRYARSGQAISPHATRPRR